MQVEAQNLESGPGQDSSRRFSWQVFAMLCIAVAAVLAPAILLGFPKGNDLEFHIPLWIDVRHQWSEHIFALRWASLAQYGFGQPIFSFYPPLSYFLGAAASYLFGWTVAPSVYVAVVLLLGGAAMFRLAAEFLPGRNALLAALLFECNPYTVFRIYHSRALAEALASSMLPLLLLFALGLGRPGRRRIFALAAVFAAIWLTNLPAGIMSSYSLAALICTLALVEKSPKALIRGAWAMLLGFGLAAFHLVPGIYEQSWLNVGGLNEPALLPENNFLPAWGYDPDVKWFAAILSCIIILGIIAGIAAVLVNWKRGMLPRSTQLCAIGLCLISCLLLFAFSQPVWLYLPKIRLIQFPWRWLAIFQAGVMFLIAAALPRSRSKAWLFTAGYLAVSLTVLTVTADYWHPRAGSEIFSRISKDHGYFGRPEYMPPGIDQKRIWPVYDAALVSPYSAVSTVDHQCRPFIRIDRWSTEDMRFSVTCPIAQSYALRLQYYPAWGAEVNGKTVQPAMDRVNGRVLVSVPAGSSSVRIRWKTTTARKVGTAISAVAFLLCFL